MKKTAFSMISLGCARSLVDSEKLTEDLHEVGFTLVAEGSQDAIVILNTCSFIQAAIAETEANIEQLIARKQRGDVQYVVVVGCYPSRFKESLLRERYPDVDLWMSTKDEAKLKDALSRLVFGEKFQPSQRPKYTKLTPSHYAYLKISEGCNNWCSFCTIPKIRGAHQSKPIAQVVAEAKLQLSMGAKELVLIAEDTTAWGEDLYGNPAFPKLLDALAALDVAWIRPMYIFPSRVNQDLIDVIKAHDNIIPYLDMPIQHVNSELLSAMNRRHDKAFLSDLFNQFKAAIPQMVWRSTFILGFPGETEDHVDELIDFITCHPFEQVGCFTYSEEYETRSRRFKEKVDVETARKRVDRVMAAQYDLVQRRHAKRLGERLSVIYEGQRLARSFREAPEVDSKLILDDATGLVEGQFLDVKVNGFDGYDLLATPL